MSDDTPAEPTAYTGHVDPGGPPAALEVAVDDATVELRKLSVGPMDNNAYVLTDLGTGEALLVDAAAEPERILAQLHGRDLRAIVTTHGHWDHWQALEEVREATGAPALLHPADRDLCDVEPDGDLADGQRITFGGAAVQAVHTPGHTPGSTCLRLGDEVLLTGDTLFPGGPGNTFGDAEAFATIMRSLRERLFTHPDTTRVCPGHGDDTTIGAERADLDAWQERGW